MIVLEAESGDGAERFLKGAFNLGKYSAPSIAFLHILSYNKCMAFIEKSKQHTGGILCPRKFLLLRSRS